MKYCRVFLLFLKFDFFIPRLRYIFLSFRCKDADVVMVRNVFSQGNFEQKTLPWLLVCLGALLHTVRFVYASRLHDCNAIICDQSSFRKRCRKRALSSAVWTGAALVAVVAVCFWKRFLFNAKKWGEFWREEFLFKMLNVRRTATIAFSVSTYFLG